MADTKYSALVVGPKVLLGAYGLNHIFSVLYGSMILEEPAIDDERECKYILKSPIPKPICAIDYDMLMESYGIKRYVNVVMEIMDQCDHVIHIVDSENKIMDFNQEFPLLYAAKIEKQIKRVPSILFV